MKYSDIRNDPDRTNKDCTVIAVALTTNSSYRMAQIALMEGGKRKNFGAYRENTCAAVQKLGYEVEANNAQMEANKNFLDRYNFSVRSNEKLPKRNAKELWFMRKHVAAYIDGEVEDWTKEHRTGRWINGIYTVTPSTDPVKLAERERIAKLAEDGYHDLVDDLAKKSEQKITDKKNATRERRNAIKQVYKDAVIEMDNFLKIDKDKRPEGEGERVVEQLKEAREYTMGNLGMMRYYRWVRQIDRKYKWHDKFVHIFVYGYHPDTYGKRFTRVDVTNDS